MLKLGVYCIVNDGRYQSKTDVLQLSFVSEATISLFFEI